MIDSKIREMDNSEQEKKLANESPKEKNLESDGPSWRWLLEAQKLRVDRTRTWMSWLDWRDQLLKKAMSREIEIQIKQIRTTWIQ